MNTRITFIGFGEAGQTISRGPLAEHAERIRACDTLFDDSANQGRLRRAELIRATRDAWCETSSSTSPSLPSPRSSWQKPPASRWCCCPRRYAVEELYAGRFD